MRKIFLISFILLYVILFTMSAYAMKNEPDNFRGIPWGAKPPRNNIFGKNKLGLTYMYGSLYYRSEEVSIGGAKITSPIKYYFFDVRGFANATVDFDGRDNYDLIRKACIENWGEPDKEDISPYMNSETGEKSVFFDSCWIGERITVVLSYEPDKYKAGSLSFRLRN